MVFSYLEVKEIIQVVSKLTVRDRENLLNCQYMFYPINIKMRTKNIEIFETARFWVRVATGNLEIDFYNSKGLFIYLLKSRTQPIKVKLAYLDLNLVKVLNSLKIK